MSSLTSIKQDQMGEKPVPSESATEHAPNDSIADDGTESEINFRSILALAASALAYFCTVGFMNAYGVFQQYYTAHYLQGESNFRISWLGSFATFCLFAFAAPAGFLADKYGPVLPVCIGVMFELVAIFTVSLCREYYQFFLAQGLALGIGMSMIVIPFSTIVPQYFVRHLSLAQGISVAGSSLGGILWPVALDQLLNHDTLDFGWSMRIVSFIMLPLLCLTCMSILVLRHPPKKAVKEDEGAEKAFADPVRKKKHVLSVLGQPAYIFLCAGLAVANFGFFIPLFYIPTYAVHIGLSENLAFYLLSILNGASMFGRILPGYAADRVGQFNILTCATLLSGILAFVWITATSTVGLIVWTIGFGFISGAILSQQLACATVLSDAESRGAAIGVALTSVSLTGLFGPPIAGALQERGGYIALSCFSGGMLLVGFGLIAVARWNRGGGIWARV